MTVCESLAGFPPPTQLAVCQLRHRQDLSLSALCALACSYTASALRIALSHRAVFSYVLKQTSLCFLCSYMQITLILKIMLL